jgi:folate-binding protein YgfZ
LAHVLIFCTPNSLIVDTAAQQGPTLVSHFDHYLITEDVQIHDRTGEWGQWLFGGPGTSEVLERFGAPSHFADNCTHTRVRFDRLPVWLRAVPWLPVPTYQLVTTQEHAESLGTQLTRAGAELCEEEAFHMARIEYGFPWYPLDITGQNLPQEIGRDQFTLNLRKGCYLGQETVARLDAMGHVNRLLCGVRFEGSDLPESGSPLTAQGKPVGQVTSAALSPRLRAPLALAYIRVSHSSPGERLASSVGPAEVISLPVDSSPK